MFLWMMGLQVNAAEPTAASDLVRILSSRDPVACSSVQTTLETWRAVVETQEGPPWVPMRAAQCLLELHATEASADLAAWVVDPEDRGLGLLVLAQLDRLPEELALALAQRALREGPDPERAKKRIATSEHAQVRALVNP